MSKLSHRRHRRLLKADQDSELIDERIAYASKFVVEAQITLKTRMIIPVCVVVSEFDPNTSTWFDVVIPNANGISKHIRVSDVESITILNAEEK